MQSRTLGKIAAFCVGAAIPVMVASQAHAAVADPPGASNDAVQTEMTSMATAQSSHGLADIALAASGSSSCSGHSGSAALVIGIG